jgi:hypothetical protein
MLRRALAVAVALPALACAGVAHADADPASDTLYTGRVFLPLSARVAPRLVRQLDTVTREAERAGRPVRVALIASPSDLGGVPSLFGRPTTYARFLAGELQFVYAGKVLIVMPQGAALGERARLVANRDVLSARVGPGADGLASAAIELVPKLAGIGRPPGSGSGISVWVWIAVAGAAVVLVGAGVTLARRGSSP